MRCASRCRESAGACTRVGAFSSLPRVSRAHDCTVAVPDRRNGRRTPQRPPTRGRLPTATGVAEAAAKEEDNEDNDQNGGHVIVLPGGGGSETWRPRISWQPYLVPDVCAAGGGSSCRSSMSATAAVKERKPRRRDGVVDGMSGTTFHNAVSGEPPAYDNTTHHQGPTAGNGRGINRRRRLQRRRTRLNIDRPAVGCDGCRRSRR